MVYSKAEAEKIMDDIARQRDEFIARIHDAKPTAREEWEEWWNLELKLQQLKTNLSATRNDRGEIISAPISLAIDEIREGYALLRRMR